MKVHAIFLLFVLFSPSFSEENKGIFDCLTGPCVTVPGVGKIQGSTKNTQFNGREISGFWGIPFGEDTGGANRFKPPQPRQQLNDGGDAYDATFLKYMTGWWNRVCPQPGVSLKGSYMDIMSQEFPINETHHTRGMMGTEDCLHLAVFTPQLPTEQHGNPKLPVMFFVHGGAFTMGGYIGSGPGKLLDRDVVLVEVQYRLGPLGFMCLPDDEAAGNQALLDQMLGLQWARDHIEHFGGDPDRITIFGESAGSASVTALTISPLSQDMFTQSIAESGSTLSSWAFDSSPEKHAREISAHVGCNQDNAKDIISCMVHEKSAVEIVDGHHAYYLEERKQGRLGFGGSSLCAQTHGTKKFLTKHPREYIIAPEYKPKPAIFGANKHEGSFVLGLMWNAYFTVNELQNDPVWLRHYFASTLLEAMGLNDDSGLVFEMLIYTFFDSSDMGDWDKMMPGMVNLVGTFFIKSATYEWMKYNSFHDVASYFYSFEYYGENSLWNLLFAASGSPPIPRGVTHGDELIYLFSVGIFQLSDQDWEMAWKMINLWANFAEFGTPIHPDHPITGIPEWPRFNEDDGSKYLALNVESSVRSDYVKTYANPDIQNFA